MDKARGKEKFRLSPRYLCLIYALLATGFCAGWQALTVRYSFGGNWSALFYTGANLNGIPPSIKFENPYLIPNSNGYDGQFYHLVAHDPLLRRHFALYIDDPRYRYSRILVPGLAYLLAFGQDARIDEAYIFVVWLSIFLGAYWLGRFAVLRGYPAWIGMAFILTPSVLISIDRLTVDAALAACVMGFALFSAERSDCKLYAVLAAAGLVRETGLLLPAAWCIYLAGERHWRRALIFATAAIPTACWFLFVRFHTAPHDFETVSPALFSGIVSRILHPFPYAFGGAIRVLADALDLLALAGIAAAVGWAFYRARQRAWSPVIIGVYLFALLTIALSAPAAWEEVSGFGRALTPLVLLAALDGLSLGTVLPALAMLAIDPRIGLQMGAQILNVGRGLLR